jgi:hypothetical protein
MNCLKGGGMPENILFSVFIQKDVRSFILPVVLLLFIIWLVHRLERRAVEEVIYKNFPFFKEAVGDFQQKLSNIDLRVGELEVRISRLENNSPQQRKGSF